MKFLASPNLVPTLELRIDWGKRKRKSKGLEIGEEVEEEREEAM